LFSLTFIFSSRIYFHYSYLQWPCQRFAEARITLEPVTYK